MTTSAGGRPIAPTDRVNDVLARGETLVDVFTRHSPHFEKLRHRSMRRIMARLVTVEQAARIAGVPLAALLHDLNDALGLPREPDERSVMQVDEEREDAVEGESQHAHPWPAPIVELDVRDDLRSGREPFSRIMAAVATMRDSDVLLLRTLFEPVPLFAVLAKRGFDHEARATAPDDWSVWFWRSSIAPSAAEPPTDVIAAIDLGDARSLVMDVRGLEPPEPLTRTLAALETLPHGHTLVQVNNRVPLFLLPLLAERGFTCDVDESQADRVLVRIWRRPSPPTTPSGAR